jgi:hypothetical protein
LRIESLGQIATRESIKCFFGFNCYPKVTFTS